MLAWLPETPSQIAAVVALVIGGVQWLAAPWRDLGVLSLAACGAALVLARGEPGLYALVTILLAIVLAGLAWARGARSGVGRPGLDGLGLIVGAAAVIVPLLLRDRLPPPAAERLVEGALVACGLVGAVGLSLALERPGPRRQRPRFFRRVPVVERPPEARGGLDDEE